MIYKLKQHETGMTMEVELFNESNQSIQVPDCINFSMFDEDTPDSYYSINLNKSDVFKLIGVLHMLHKEMK